MDWTLPWDPALGMQPRHDQVAIQPATITFADVPCRAIAQGCSEYNITILVDQRDAKRALRTVHGRFYLASLPIAIGIVGMSGQIGTTFMQQLRDRAEVTCSAVLAVGRGPDTAYLAPLVLPQGGAVGNHSALHSEGECCQLAIFMLPHHAETLAIIRFHRKSRCCRA